MSNNLPKCHRSIPCRASGLVQIADALIELCRRLGFEFLANHRLFGSYSKTEFCPDWRPSGRYSSQTGSPALMQLSLSLLEYAILSFNALSPGKALRWNPVLALTYIFLTPYEPNRCPPT